MSIQDRIEAGVLRTVMGLPPRLQRGLAGRPLLRDGQTLAVDTQLMLRLQQVAKEPGAETLPIADGRDAIRRQAGLAGGVQPIGSVRDLSAGGVPARLYTPTGTTGPGPMLVFLHGGGFIYGDLASHDAPCRFLAERAGVRVLALDYRLAPEQPFPAAYDDCVAGYRWAVEHAVELGADATRIGVGGDSAGGNLAAGVAIEAARAGVACAFQLLIYPVTTLDHPFPSATMFGSGLFLTTEFMRLATESYVGVGAAEQDARFAPLAADLPAGLAPAYVATAGFDPLRDEGEAYARKLAAAGVEVETRRFRDQIHGFLNVVGVGRTARAANAEIAVRLMVGLAERARVS